MSASPAKRLMQADDFYRIITLEDPRVSPDGEWIAYVQVTIDRLENTYMRNIWLAPTSGEKPIQLTRGGKDTQPRWSPDGSMLAFTSARNEKPQVYVLRLVAPGGDPRALTSMENGAYSPDWSPDGIRIAFLAGMNEQERAKESAGEKADPLADKLEVKHRAERKEEDEKKRWDPRWVKRIPYREGTSFNDDRFGQVYVMPVAEGLSEEESKPRRLTNTDANYSQPKWTPDGKYILTDRTNYPDQDEPWVSNSLYRIDVDEGREEQLTSDKFVDINPLPSPDGKWILYFRTPRKNHTATIDRLAILPVEGGEARDLSYVMDRSPLHYRWSPDSRFAIFDVDDWGTREIYRADIETGEIEKIVSGLMDSDSLDVAPKGGVAFVAVTPLSPTELFWQPPGADEPLQLTEVNKPLLDEVIVQPTHELRVTASDGQEIQAWYILPPGYEKGKKYPLAFNVHGGPHVMWSPSARTMWHEWQHHAASGYVVLYSNPRGADGYGEVFRDAIHAKWGEPAFTDLMAVVDAALEKGFVDEKRMAVTGGSYGGYMTGWIVGHTDRFACAFAARGVYNLLSFYGTSDIPLLISEEFDVEPWEDHELLWKWSPLAYAHLIKTPLLIKAGENDFRVPIEQSEQLYAVARRSGAPVEFIRYPRDGHELSRSGEPEHRLSRLNVMIDWFDKYCKSGE